MWQCTWYIYSAWLYNGDDGPLYVCGSGSTWIYATCTIHMHITTATCNHQHPVQVAQVQVEYLRQLVEAKYHQWKVQRSGPALTKLEGEAAATCNYNHHMTDQIRTSTGAIGVHEAAINATCVRAHHITSTCPNVCCIDCYIRQSPTAPVLALIWSVVWWL